MQLITPDLEDFMEPVDVSGHVFSPNNFRAETLEWIENRNNKSGCRIPCLTDTDLRIIPALFQCGLGSTGMVSQP